MKDVELFPHNEKAYQKLLNSLKINRFTTINHATGTGKSFIALKFIYEFRQKKGLYISPTYPIIDQLMDSSYSIGLTPEELNIDTVIYGNLQGVDMKKLYEKYDYFILDEYHRAGAKLVYKKLKELRYLVKNGKKDKKVIGLTATRKRYLDKERDMTEELFDGNVASELSLSEAMLENLLPTPFYYNSKIACREELEKAQKRIDKMSDGKFKAEKQKELDKVGEEINNGAEDYRNMINKYIEKKDGKYIVFCDSISELYKCNAQIDGWFKDKGKVKKYIVHSRIKEMTLKGNENEGKSGKQINKETLKKFNEEKEGISILLCVDALNEGVHVKGIDGVFLFRKTLSPIIYFQQIGRCLSFSGRNKQIQIFDMVNNFKNHSAIELIYQELHEEYERKIKENPENTEKYKEVLARFKIMDETKEILEKISKIERSITKEKIIESRIDDAIKTLQNIPKNRDFQKELFSNTDIKAAYKKIDLYASYVNNEQFEKLYSLNIILPQELSMSIEQRKQYLGEFETINEKTVAENNRYMERIINFVKENKRVPKISTESQEETLLAKNYLRKIFDADSENIEKLRNLYIQNKVKITPIEKIALGIKISQNDVDAINNLAKKYIANGKELPIYLKTSIERMTRRYDLKEGNELLDLVIKSEKIRSENYEKQQKLRFETVGKVEEILQEHINSSWDELVNLGIIEIVNKFKPADVTYIKRKYEIMKQKNIEKKLNILSLDSIVEFCKKLKNMTDEQIDIYYDLISKSNNINNITIELLRFIEQNDKKFPKKESNIKEERDLANRYLKSPYKEEIEKRIKLVIKDDNKLCNIKRIMYKISLSEIEKNNTKTVILKCFKFLKENGRKPLINSLDEEEANLAKQYQYYCIKNIDSESMRLIDKIFNSKDSFKNASKEFFKNLKKAEGMEP